MEADEIRPGGRPGPDPGNLADPVPAGSALAHYDELVRKGYPPGNLTLAYLAGQVITDLRQENEALKHEVERAVRELHLAKGDVRLAREKLAAVQAELDRLGDYQVFIAPGWRYVSECLAILDASPDVRDGDRLRVSDTGREYVRRGGIWRHA